MYILTLNAGSSSVKYHLVNTDTHVSVIRGEINSIHQRDCTHHYTVADNGRQDEERRRPLPDAPHNRALQDIVEVLTETFPRLRIDAVGHRVVHGADRYRHPTIIDDQVAAQLADLDPLAPLHNPANRAGITLARRHWPEAVHVAVFDTGFFGELPHVTRHYPLPLAVTQRYGIRRYGFHGIAHQYLVDETAAFLGTPLKTLNLITLHLGSGASLAATRGGRCIDTSMGMTPLAGVMMSTRSGDIDPSILFFLQRQHGFTVERLEAMLNHDSGLQGLCGTPDMREVHHRRHAGDTAAQQAFDMFCYRIRHYLGAYLVTLGRIDALVFSGGIGENDPQTRDAVCSGLSAYGITLDPAANRANRRDRRAIHHESASTSILVIPANEELAIARQTEAALRRRQRAPDTPGCR